MSPETITTNNRRDAKAARHHAHVLRSRAALRDDYTDLAETSHLLMDEAWIEARAQEIEEEAMLVAFQMDQLEHHYTYGGNF